MNREKKIINIAVMVIFSLVLIVGAVTMEVVRSYRDVRRMESAVAAVQEFVDKDKYVYFNLFLDIETTPDNGAYIIHHKEPQKIATVNEGEDGTSKLSTHRDAFKESTKLVYEIENVCRRMEEHDLGSVSIEAYNDIFMNDVRYYNVLLGRFNVSVIDEFSLKIEYDDKVEIIKVGETYKGKHEFKFYGNKANLIFELTNYGALKKSESNFNVEDWQVHLDNKK